MYSRYKALHAEAYYFRILANPKRLQVIHLLQRRQLTVSDMERAMEIRQANLFQHLMILRQARVITTEHKGRKVYYHLTCPGLTRIPTTLRVTRMASSTARTKNTTEAGKKVVG